MFVVAVRLVFAVLGAVAAYQLTTMRRQGEIVPSIPERYNVVTIIVLVLLGALVGFVAGGFLGRGAQRLRAHFEQSLVKVPGSQLVVGTAGLIVGLGIAALFSMALKDLPFVGDYLLVPFFLIVGYITAYLAARKHTEILRLVGINPAPHGSDNSPVPRKVFDSSAIIDGRVGDIVKTHFLDGELLIPRFVVHELQRVADSGDPEKRIRGRRGLDVVKELKGLSRRVRVIDNDYDDLTAVDAKLVRLALELHADILTTDYNLNKVADIQGVRVLNVNELANAVKTVVLPGEQIEVKVLREGREHEQGVGYLDDGTMIVVEGARPLIGSTVKAEVTSVLQSPSGKMIFTKLAR
ncbi:MAG TPA: TRAM domain-containing protein [Thermoleophilia bacterium]|nr:TRAM domain-containing protein [Thermoleophilia bacterium]